jgi:hypothetical protein
VRRVEKAKPGEGKKTNWATNVDLLRTSSGQYCHLDNERVCAAVSRYTPPYISFSWLNLARVRSDASGRDGRAPRRFRLCRFIVGLGWVW